jgi:hypothetical protein
MSAQRLEQNGLKAGSAGLPQIGQDRTADVFRSISFMSEQNFRLSNKAHVVLQTGFSQPKRTG